MSLLDQVVSTLSFDDTAGRSAAALRRLYFGIAYNTMLPVNLMLALGSMTPYLVFLALHGQLTFGAWAAGVTMTVVSAYFYQLIYIVNDLFDRKKDERLAIPKQTARHVNGEGYLTGLAISYVAVVTAASLVWHNLLGPLVGYGLSLMALSVVHSKAGKLKWLTIFTERWAKFCSPLALTYLATGTSTAKFMLAGALVVYPLGFTLDYAYHGYLRDRLHMRSYARWWLYAVYWLLAGAGILAAGRGSDTAAALAAFDLYLMIYFLAVTLAYILADAIKFGFLNEHYPVRVAAEKRLILTYGLMQLMMVVAGAVYVAVK